MPLKILKHSLSAVILTSLCTLNVWSNDIWSDSSDFYAITHNKSTNQVLNSFGVHTAFMINVADSARAQKVQEKSRYFMQKFANGYEFIPTLKNMMAKEEIMPATGKSLGLEINSYIDERKDPIRSTEAAIKYLKYLYEITGEWYLAAMAYNCGPGRLKRGIEEAGGDTRIETLLDDEAQYLPAETRNYIRTILAMSLLFNDVDFLKAQNADYLLNRGATDSIASVSVKGGVSLSTIAQSAKIPLSELKKYNRHFVRSTLPQGNKRYNVYLPYDKLRNFKRNFNEKHYKQNTSPYITHIVQQGENLGIIAKNYKVSIQAIQEINNIKGTNIFANQQLTIPVSKNKATTIADSR